MSTSPVASPYTAIVLKKTTRSTPAAREASTTARVPPTLVRSYASRSEPGGSGMCSSAARWTTTEAPLTASRTNPAFATSPVLTSTSADKTPGGGIWFDSVRTEKPLCWNASTTRGPTIPVAPVTSTSLKRRPRPRWQASASRAASRYTANVSRITISSRTQRQRSRGCEPQYGTASRSPTRRRIVVREGHRVPRRDQQPVLARPDDLTTPGNIGGDEWSSSRGSLQQGLRHTLSVAWEEPRYWPWRATSGMSPLVAPPLHDPLRLPGFNGRFRDGLRVLGIRDAHQTILTGTPAASAAAPPRPSSPTPLSQSRRDGSTTTGIPSGRGAVRTGRHRRPSPGSGSRARPGPHGGLRTSRGPRGSA